MIITHFAIVYQDWKVLKCRSIIPLSIIVVSAISMTANGSKPSSNRLLMMLLLAALVDQTNSADVMIRHDGKWGRNETGVVNLHQEYLYTYNYSVVPNIVSTTGNTD